MGEFFSTLWFYVCCFGEAAGCMLLSAAFVGIFMAALSVTNGLSLKRLIS